MELQTDYQDENNTYILIGDCVKAKTGKVYLIYTDSDLDIILYDPFLGTMEQLNEYNSRDLRIV